MTETYKRLIEAVEEINPEAADFLRAKASQLSTFVDHRDYGSLAEKLSSAFIWATAPQGHEFWQEITTTLYNKEEA